MGEVAPARACAFKVITRVFERGAYADRALHAEAAGLGPRDRALAMALSYGTVQRRRTLDYVIAALCSRPLASLGPGVRDALRLGVLQIALMDGIAELWWEQLGAGEARALLRTVNLPPESALRVNTLRATVPEVLERLDVPASPAPDLDEALVLHGPFDAHGSQLFADGAIMPQSRASMVVARESLAQPGQRVLDLCAAPGGKTTHLAALIEDRSPEFVAVEVHPGRARALERTCTRMHARSVRVRCADGREPVRAGPFETVLVDPPCSGLGTLQARPDLRWQARRADLEALAAKQSQLLAAGAAAAAPGGILVYAVCTISLRESREVVRGLLDCSPAFALEHERQLTPHRDGTDGFFIARLRRR